MRTYHVCGYPIWAETQAKELSHTTIYRDDDEESDTYGEAVTRCPLRHVRSGYVAWGRSPLGTRPSLFPYALTP